MNFRIGRNALFEVHLGAEAEQVAPRLFVFEGTTRSGRANPPHCFVVSELRESCRRSAARSGLRLFLSFCRTRPKNETSSGSAAATACSPSVLGPFSGHPLNSATASLDCLGKGG